MWKSVTIFLSVHWWEVRYLCLQQYGNVLYIYGKWNAKWKRKTCLFSLSLCIPLAIYITDWWVGKSESFLLCKLSLLSKPNYYVISMAMHNKELQYTVEHSLFWLYILIFVNIHFKLSMQNDGNINVFILNSVCKMTAISMFSVYTGHLTVVNYKDRLSIFRCNRTSISRVNNDGPQP